MGVVLDGAPLVAISQECGAVVNDVALLLPGKIDADPRNFKEDAPDACTDCSKRWLYAIPHGPQPSAFAWKGSRGCRAFREGSIPDPGKDL
jgi:hypothetical protein